MEAMLDMILHPEYNSSLILRAEVLSDVGVTQDTIVPPLQDLSGYSPIRILRRRLLPRRPGRDSSIEQDCVFYASNDTPPLEKRDAITLVVLYPMTENDTLPFYHPRVRALAFRYLPITSDVDAGSARLHIDVIPLDAHSESTNDPGSRLYRTCLALAEMVWRVGHGKMTGYKKRVVHDVCR
jgi:tRNASer (uridine44-2'-O)-methyltransferase